MLLRFRLLQPKGSDVQGIKKRLRLPWVRQSERAPSVLGVQHGLRQVPQRQHPAVRRHRNPGASRDLEILPAQVHDDPW